MLNEDKLSTIELIGGSEDENNMTNFLFQVDGRGREKACSIDGRWTFIDDNDSGVMEPTSFGDSAKRYV